MKVVILMGSYKDLDHCKKIAKALDFFGIPYVMRVASAHKTPDRVLEIVREYENEDSIVFITVAGRSNALSGIVDGCTTHPVIACPPLRPEIMEIDIFSSLRLPSGVAALTIVEPESAALAAAKILAVKHPELRERVRQYQEMKRREVEEADRRVLEGVA